jgi:hypothetical protein
MATHLDQAAKRPATEMSPEQQKAFYEDNGYLVFPSLLDDDELARLRGALAEVLSEAEGLTESTDKFSVTKTDDGGYSVRRIFNPTAHHQAFYDLVFNPKIVDRVENLIGPNIQLHHTKATPHKAESEAAEQSRSALRVAPGLSVLPAHEFRPSGGHDLSGRLD